MKWIRWVPLPGIVLVPRGGAIANFWKYWFRILNFYLISYTITITIDGSIYHTLSVCTVYFLSYFLTNRIPKTPIFSAFKKKFFLIFFFTSFEILAKFWDAYGSGFKPQNYIIFFLFLSFFFFYFLLEGKIVLIIRYMIIKQNDDVQDVHADHCSPSPKTFDFPWGPVRRRYWTYWEI